MKKYFEPLKLNYFKTEDFADIFNSDEKMAESFYEACKCGYDTSNYKCFCLDDDYYILNYTTGVLIGWHKHEGVDNICNVDGFTLSDLAEFLQGLYDDLRRWHLD